MSDTSTRNRTNRARGKTWERGIRDYLRGLGFDIERTRDTGTKDEGDLVIRHGGLYHVIEAKNAKLEPTGFLREAALEAKHFAEHRFLSPDLAVPVVFVKRRGFGSPGDGLAIMTVDQYANLIRRIGVAT